MGLTFCFIEINVTTEYNRKDQSIFTALERFKFSRRSMDQRCSIEKLVLKNFAIFTGKHLHCSLFFKKLQAFRPATLLKETPTQVLSSEYCKVFKNTNFEEHFRTAASVAANEDTFFVIPA